MDDPNQNAKKLEDLVFPDVLNQLAQKELLQLMKEWNRNEDEF